MSDWILCTFSYITVCSPLVCMCVRVCCVCASMACRPTGIEAFQHLEGEGGTDLEEIVNTTIFHYRLAHSFHE